METLPELQRRIDTLAARISAPAHLLPTYGRSEDFARPHLEADSRGLHYVIEERGQEQERRTTSAADELLYWAFQSVTFSMASSYEVHHRIHNQDSRRLLFKHQVQLLQQLSPAWATRREAELQRILLHSPYDDATG